jgi:hypothetical protein
VRSALRRALPGPDTLPREQIDLAPELRLVHERSGSTAM